LPWPYTGASSGGTYAVGALATVGLTFFLAQSYARLGDVFWGLQPFRLGILAKLALAIALFQLRNHGHLLSAGQHWTTKAVAILAVLGVITVPTGAWPTASVEYYTGVYIVSLMVFVAAAIAFAYPETRKTVLVTVILLAAVAAARPLVYSITYRYGIGWTYDSNVTAAYLAMLVPWSAAWASTEIQAKWKWIPIAALPLLIMGVARTGSRGGILGLFVAIPFLWLIAPPRRRTQIVMLMAVLGVVFATYARKQLSATASAFTNNEDYNYQHIDGRIPVWKRGIGYAKESPVLGHGINGFRYRELAWKVANLGGGRETAAHNMYVEVAVDLGVGGLLAFIVGCVAGVGSAWRVRKRAIERFRTTGDRADSDLAVFGGAAAASLLSVMVTGFFLSLAHQAPLYMAWGAAVGVTLAERIRLARVGGPMPSAAAPGPPGPAWGGARGWRSRGSYARWRLKRG
jgi:O-antigen ligase